MGVKECPGFPGCSLDSCFKSALLIECVSPLLFTELSTNFFLKFVRCIDADFLLS